MKNKLPTASDRLEGGQNIILATRIVKIDTLFASSILLFEN